MMWLMQACMRFYKRIIETILLSNSNSKSYLPDQQQETGSLCQQSLSTSTTASCTVLLSSGIVPAGHKAILVSPWPQPARPGARSACWSPPPQ